jgi:hypothetical protein
MTNKEGLMKDPDLLKKMNILFSHGWKKERGKWVDPLSWKTYESLQAAWLKHLRYEEKHK